MKVGFVGVIGKHERKKRDKAGVKLTSDIE